MGIAHYQLADCNTELALRKWMPLPLLLVLCPVFRLIAWHLGHASLFHKPAIIDDETTLAKSLCSFGVADQRARCRDCRRCIGTHRLQVNCWLTVEAALSKLCHWIRQVCLLPFLCEKIGVLAYQPRTSTLNSTWKCPSHLGE